MQVCFFVMRYVGLPHCIVKGTPKDLIFLQFLDFCCGLVPYLCAHSFSLGVNFSVCYMFSLATDPSMTLLPCAKHK